MKGPGKPIEAMNDERIRGVVFEQRERAQESWTALLAERARPAVVTSHGHNPAAAKSSPRADRVLLRGRAVAEGLVGGADANVCDNADRRHLEL